MSLIAISLNLFLAGLLLAALGLGFRLDRRLKTLRDSQQAFQGAAVELNAAVGRAREGLADLRGGADEALDLLGSRINRAREQAERLERAVRAAEGLAVQPPLAPEPARTEMRTGGGGLDALLADLKRAEAPATARRRLADDDLFVAEPEGRA